MSAPAKRAAAAVLFDWMMRQRDADGLVAIRTTAMADATGLGRSTVELLLARWAAMGVVPVIRRGGNTGPSVRRPVAARRAEAAGIAAVHPAKEGPGGKRQTGAPVVPNGPPLRAAPPVRTRCPRCNLPPAHGECLHGWNGLTTRSERRAIAAEGGMR